MVPNNNGGDWWQVKLAVVNLAVENLAEAPGIHVANLACQQGVGLLNGGGGRGDLVGSTFGVGNLAFQFGRQI